MCRNIKTLFNFEPPVTEEEIRAASLQFVRKVSGFRKPSKANEAAFLAAVAEIAAASSNLLRSLATNAPARKREEKNRLHLGRQAGDRSSRQATRIEGESKARLGAFSVKQLGEGLSLGPEKEGGEHDDKHERWIEQAGTLRNEDVEGKNV